MNRLLTLALLSAIACGKTRSSASASEEESSASETEGEGEGADAGAPMDAREAAQWEAAAQGEPEELMRLEDLVGCRGLRERARESGLRMTALRAMQYCPDFSELGWLARVAQDANDAEAHAALETVDVLAARPRRATDPEDADELHSGCAALAALAGADSRPRDRRLLAMRALRMLADRGCRAPEARAKSD